MRKVAFWLSLVLIFVIPWENMIFVKGLGTASRVIGLVVGAFWVATVVAMGRFRKPHAFHMAVYLFMLWNVVSAFWSLDIEATVSRLKTCFQLFILIFILWDLYTSPAALKAGLQAYVLGAYVSTGSIVGNYLASIQRSYLRYSSTGFNADDIGLILALGIPVAWYLTVSEGNSKMIQVLRLVNYAYIPAAILGIVLTATRGAFVSALPALLFVVRSLTRLNFFLRVLILAALIAALFTLQSLVPQSSLQRLATTGTSIAEGDIGGRVEIWRKGLAAFAEHPLLGIGSGTFKAIASGSSAHNSYLSVIIEVGIVGFVLFVIILAVTVYQATHQPKWDSRLWLTILLVLAIGVSTLTWEHRKQTWLFLSLVIVSAGLSSQRDEAILR